MLALTSIRFEAGTDTTSSALATFILAAIANPQVLIAAQKEVDEVCGEEPPSMAHFQALEYVRAVCKETLRWRTVTPGGKVHVIPSILLLSGRPVDKECIPLI